MPQSSILQCFDELAPIGDKSGTRAHHRFEALAEASTTSNGDRKSSNFEVPISEFVRPSKRRLKTVRRMTNTKEKYYGNTCAEGCQCKSEQREEFPSICPPKEVPGLPETAMWGHDKSRKGSLAMTDALVIKDVPVRPETAVWGHGKSHKGSSVDTKATVELKVPARSEIAIWGHDKIVKGSLAEASKHRWSRKRSVGFDDAVADEGGGKVQMFLAKLHALIRRLLMFFTLGMSHQS